MLTENDGEFDTFPTEIIDPDKKPEGRPGKKEVTLALNGGLKLLQKELAKSPNEKLAWIVQSIEGAQAKIKSQKRKDGKFKNEWTDPQFGKAEIEEGIPVDGLIAFLKEKGGKFSKWAEVLEEGS